MDDDFNTAGALAAIFGLVTTANTYLKEAGDNTSTSVTIRASDTLCELCAVLGIDLVDTNSKEELPEELVDLAVEYAEYEGTSASEAAQALLAARQAARSEKNWTLADNIRDAIAALGLSVEDTPAGARLIKKD